MAQQKGFACPACGAEFETREQLDNHKKREHQQAAQPPSDVPGTAGREPSPGRSGAGGQEQSPGRSGTQGR